MDRRDFLKYSAAGFLVLGSNDISTFARKAKLLSDHKDVYSVVILGDTHYDVMPDTIYHTGYTDKRPTREAHHRREFVRNAEMWKERMPRLLKRASMLVDESTSMVLQTGDLIQGDTGDALSHKKMLSDAMDKMKAYMGPLPHVTVMGNHDMRGTSDAVATQAYKEYMCERMSQELNRKVTDINFSFTIGHDAYIVIDFNNPDVKVLERLLKETEGARYTFLLVHGPVIPYDSSAYSTWYYFGPDRQNEERRYVRQLLAKRNTIVLCGHTHTTDFTEWKGDGGMITQMTMSSVWDVEGRGVHKVISDGADQYGLLRMKAAEDKDPELAEKYMRQINEYRSGITRYMHSVTAGSYRLNVSPNKVTIDFYAGDSVSRTSEFILR